MKIFSRIASATIRNKKILAVVTGALGLAAATSAHAGVAIVGGLSNFDSTNNTGSVENEFQIELPSVDPSAIAGFWANVTWYKGSGYGTPTETKSASSDGVAGHTSTYVDYYRSGVSTPVGFTEHFGIHFKNPSFMPPATIYTWKNAGVPFNYALPSITVATAPNPSGGTTVTPVVVNTTTQTLIVEFRSALTTPVNPEGVQLSDLVDTNPEVQIVEAETEPGSNGGPVGVVLKPGEILGVDGEAHDPTDLTDPVVTNPQGWLAAHPSDHGFSVDLNQAGESALTTLSVFEAVSATAAGTTTVSRGANIANVFSAINTAPAPEPTTAVLLSAMAGAMLLRRRRA